VQQRKRMRMHLLNFCYRTLVPSESFFNCLIFLETDFGSLSSSLSSSFFFVRMCSNTTLSVGLRKVLFVSHDPGGGPLSVLVLAVQPLPQLAAGAAVAHRP